MSGNYNLSTKLVHTLNFAGLAPYSNLVTFIYKYGSNADFVYLFEFVYFKFSI